MTEAKIDADDELGLLDVAVIIAENWLLLFIAPALVGLLAFAVLSATTSRTYDSDALLRIDAAEAALMQSATVLDPALSGSAYLDDFGGSLSRARQSLAGQAMSIAKESEPDLYRVSLRYKSADGAQNLLTKIVTSLVKNSTPAASQTALLRLQLEQAESSIAELEATLAQINGLATSKEGGVATNAATIGELGQAFVVLSEKIENGHARVYQLQEALIGSVSPEDVIQPPTLADSANPSGVLVRSLLVAIAFGLAALVCAFVGAGLKNACRTADGLRKINRIRRAFWLKPKA